MIFIGVTGWGDHDSLYDQPNTKNKLAVYASHFPIVEVDTSFYAIPPIKNVEKWVKDTPSNFQFIVKAFQGMTLHTRGEIPFSSRELMFEAFKESLKPFINSKKLAMVLFQFPPWFDCTKENVQYLRWCKQQMGNIPCALEFRHRSWFFQEYMDKTISFMKEEGWIHSICDEPDAGMYSIPTVLKVTDKEKTCVRFHGRNVHGWNRNNHENWREVRYLYNYNDRELLEWKDHLLKLQKESKNLYVLFNNNSGNDAAINAKRLIELLGIEYEGLAPRQLELF